MCNSNFLFICFSRMGCYRVFMLASERDIVVQYDPINILLKADLPLSCCFWEVPYGVFIFFFPLPLVNWSWRGFEYSITWGFWNSLLSIWSWLLSVFYIFRHVDVWKMRSRYFLTISFWGCLIITWSLEHIVKPRPWFWCLYHGFILYDEVVLSLCLQWSNTNFPVLKYFHSDLLVWSLWRNNFFPP